MNFFRRNISVIFIFATAMLCLTQNAVGQSYETPMSTIQQQSDGVRVTPVSERLSDLGEAPHWDVNSQKLYYVDINGGDICRLDPKTGVTEAVHIGDFHTSIVIPYRSDHSKLLITSSLQVRKLDFETGQSEVLAEVPPGPKGLFFNDGKCDALGRAWIGTLDQEEEDQCHLYRLDSGYTLTPVLDQISISNGLTWSLDNKKMYYIDSAPRLIYSFDYNLQDGTLSNKQILINQNDSRIFDNLGIPDGMTIDEDGKLWVVQYDGGCVLHIDPVSKNVLRKIDMPVKTVTSCCFGGPQMDILYVTTRKNEYQPQSGAVFAITGLGTKGLPLNDFVEP